MIDPNTGLEVKEPGEGGAGPGAGASAGGEAGKVTDQEFDLTLGDGSKMKVKSSDIVDEKGVSYRNRAAEAVRRNQELEAEIASRPPAGGSKEEASKPGEFTDPADGQKYTEDDVNRMYMTGEGLKAQRIVLSQINVRKVVSDVVTENDTRLKVISAYPDLKVPNTEFFRRVARHMAANDLYGKPQGMAWAARDIADQMSSEGVPFTKGVITSTPEGQRGSHTGAGVIPGGSGGRPPMTTPELDEEGKALAAKLGVDPAKMAKRLEQRLASRPKRGEE